jgi:hypothetical protein
MLLVCEFTLLAIAAVADRVTGGPVVGGPGVGGPGINVMIITTNFSQFLPIFGENFGALLKSQCYDTI